MASSSRLRHHRHSPLPHTASHEQPRTRCLVALVGVFAAPSSVLLPMWQVHQDLGIIGTHLFCKLPLTNNPRLDVWLLRWERSLPLPWCFFRHSQFHGVIKKHLKSSIQGISQAPFDKLAVCGDINRFALRSNCYRVVGRTDPFTIRNVLCSSIPSLLNSHTQVHVFAKGVDAYRMNPAMVSRRRCKRSSSNSGLAMVESERVGELRIFLLSSPADVISTISQY